VDNAIPHQVEGSQKSNGVVHKLNVMKHFDEAAASCREETKALQWEKYMIMIDTPLKGRILDLGCGIGLLQEFLQKKIVGVDISFQMLKRAKTKEAAVQADMDFMPFHDSVFDAVYSFTSLQCLPSLDYIFSEVRRVLKKDHPFIFTILRKWSSPLLYEKVKSCFEIETIRECGEDMGFVCR
jgi:ubiquinone/menaquinone biosynthesis C-methylase UbiE